MTTPSGLQLQLIPSNGNNAVIRIEDYTFTISKSTGANWKDITSGRDWQQLKTTILGLFSEMIEKKTLQSGSLYVDGDFSDIESTLKERELSFVSANLKFLDGSETKSKTISNLDGAAQTVREKFALLGKDFATIRPVTSQQNSNEYEQVDPRLEICKNRAKHVARDVSGEKPQLNFALADHMTNMGFDITSPSSADVKHEIESCLKNNKNAVLTDLRDQLIQAKSQNQSAFTNAILTNRQKFDKFANLNTVRTLEISQNGDDLIELYVEYIHQGGTLGNELYLHAFAQRFGKGIVLIEEDGVISKAKSAYPLNKTEINTKECVFVHLNKQTGKYSTYERASPIDLDKSTTPLQSAPVRRKKVASSAARAFPANDLVDLGANGQCLDRSIAYQIMRRKNIPDPARSPVDLNTIAKQLRTQTAQVLSNDYSLDTDEDFTRELATSISNIPNPILDATHEIKQIVAQRTYEGISVEAAAKRAQLRAFYANYITTETITAGRTEMNYLDSAFLYLLPRIPETVFGYKIRCAVVQGTDVTMKFPPNEELTVQAIFVYYNNINHYVAFNTSFDVVAKFKEMIQRENDRILLNFAEQIGSTAPVKERLLELKAQHPKAFQAICGLVYEHDHAAWESSDKKFPEPQDSGLPNNPMNYPYGEWRVNDASEADLKRILTTFSVGDIKGKIS